MAEHETMTNGADDCRRHGPLVSVIIPTYNRAEYVVEAVMSVMQQTYSNLEIIIVDDGSKDGTKQRLEPLLMDRRVHYIGQENTGPAAARNRGLDAATGSFIAFLDSDDLWLPNSVEDRVSAFDSLPASVGIVFGDYHRELEAGRDEPETFLSNAGYDVQFRSELRDPSMGDEECLVMNDAFRELQAVQCAINTPTTMIRQSVVGGHRFDPFFRACQDWDFFTRVSMTCAVACLLRPTAKVRFWIAGTTADHIRQTHFERILIRRHLKMFSDRGVRHRMRNRIAAISYHRAYSQYRLGARWRCLVDCFSALRWGYAFLRVSALIGMALVPASVRNWGRAVNPWRGEPIE